MADRPATSHKEILRSSSIIGGSAVINIAVGLLKTKIVALILGPAGLGLIVLLQNLMQTAASIASLGLGQAGTRAVAEAGAAGDSVRIATVRRALSIGAAVLALVSALLIVAFSGALAEWMSPGSVSGSLVRWLAIGVAATVAAQAQTALLMGHRRVGDLARLSILSVIVSAVVGVLAVWWWREDGVVAFVLVQVLATFIIGMVYVYRLPRAPAAVVRAVEIVSELKSMIGFGAALTVAAICVNAGQLFARTLIQQQLGAEAVGLFQASWLISVTYLGFVLQAMGTDFYPRIVAAAGDRPLLVRLVNEQIEVALLLSAPVLLGMLGLAPWLVRLLYSRAFDPAVAVLQWQVLGDVLKVASWPLGYLLLAIKASRLFMVAEIATIAVLVGLLWLLLPLMGLEASGAAVLGMYLFYLPLVLGIAAVRVRFRPTSSTIALFATLAAACAAVMALSRAVPLAGAALGVTLALLAGGLGVIRLRDALPGPVQRVVAMVSWLPDRR